MLNKIVKLFGSLRFWSIVVFAIALYLSKDGIIPQSVADLIQVISGGVFTKDQLDHFSKK
jgi:hypothetical protein